MRIHFVVLLIVFMANVSCNVFNPAEEKNPVARVNNTYLYKQDIEGVIVKGISKEDSTLQIQNFINNWATQQLLLHGAEINLTEDTQNKFDNLVNQYRIDLYIKAYLEAIVKQNINMEVSNKEAITYYNVNKEAFKLNEELLKFRYIHVDNEINNFDVIKQQFKRYNKEDKIKLDSIAIQFKSYSLNDSIWVKMSQVISKIPSVNPQNKKQLLKKSNFIQIKDSLGVYLMQIKDVLVRNDTAPMDYVRPTLNQIVINKRKLELVKNIEKEITKDAIKNKEFEIYN